MMAQSCAIASWKRENPKFGQVGTKGLIGHYDYLIVIEHPISCILRNFLAEVADCWGVPSHEKKKSNPGIQAKCINKNPNFRNR